MNNVVKMPQADAAQEHLEMMVLSVADAFLIICGYAGVMPSSEFHKLIYVPSNDEPLEIADNDPKKLGSLLTDMVNTMPEMLNRPLLKR